MLERAVEFNDGVRKSTGRIDLYKRGCFVLETKQGTQTVDQQKAVERADLGLAPEKRRKGHAVRGTTIWGQMMEAARQQALGYVRALPPDEPRPLFVLESPGLESPGLATPLSGMTQVGADALSETNYLLISRASRKPLRAKMKNPDGKSPGV